jgi:hypothetical protein
MDKIKARQTVERFRLRTWRGSTGQLSVVPGDARLKRWIFLSMCNVVRPHAMDR